MIRILAIIAGLGVGGGLSQFPEFSQQYLQRLGGAVDELKKVVADFDQSATAVGLTRQQALEGMSEGEFVERRRADMEATIEREVRLTADLKALENASMVSQVLQPWRFTDSEIAAATWDAFKPAVPVTPAGLGFGLAGFGLGAGAVGGAGYAFRRKGAKSQKMRRKQPQRLDRGTAAGGPRPGLPLSWLTRNNLDAHNVVMKGDVVVAAVRSIPAGQRQQGTVPEASDLMVVCVEGSGLVTGGGLVRTVDMGELAILPPSTIYEIRNTGEGIMRVFTVEPYGAEPEGGTPPLVAERGPVRAGPKLISG